MMQGFISADREAVLPLPVRGPDGLEKIVEAVIDTGFNGFLTLPASLITDLALPFVGTTQATLGDGSQIRMDVHEAIVRWDNRERMVLTLASKSGVLVGMSMLFGHRVILDVHDGVVVRIEALPHA